MKLQAFPLVHKAFNAFCVVFKMYCIILYNKPNAQPFIGAHVYVAFILSQSFAILMVMHVRQLSAHIY